MYVEENTCITDTSAKLHIANSEMHFMINAPRHLSVNINYAFRKLQI